MIRIIISMKWDTGDQTDPEKKGKRKMRKFAKT